jgi:histidinol-phosphatase
MRCIPFFSTLIGIQHNKKMVAGVMHFPALEETYYGSLSEGAYWDTPQERGRKIQVSSTQSVMSSSFVSTSVDYFRQSGRLNLFNRLSSTSGCTLSYPDAYAFALVASGRADYVVEPGVKAWDIAAAKPIIEAAGGIFCDFTGKDSIYTGSAVASNRFLHSEILRTIQEF